MGPLPTLSSYHCRLVALQDGFCVPATEEIGCGTTGTPPCPHDIVDEEGTLAILTAPNGGDPWKIKASIGIEKDGCLYRCTSCCRSFPCGLCLYPWIACAHMSACRCLVERTPHVALSQLPAACCMALNATMQPVRSSRRPDAPFARVQRAQQADAICESAAGVAARGPQVCQRLHPLWPHRLPRMPLGATL